jgi:methionine-gamma-lyase
MSEKHPDELRPDSLCIHAGQAPDPVFGAVAPPIFQTSTFAFESCDQGAARFAGREPGFIYTRMGNPTTAMLEANVTALEHGFASLATASGMAAVSTVHFGLLSQGAHVVGSSSMYGPSRVVLERDFSRFGVSATFVDTGDFEAVKAAWRPETKLLYVETPTNPTLAITDIVACSQWAHEHGALMVVDNTFMSPILQRPLDHGADIVLHSVTKFLNGHADVVGGLLVFKEESLLKKLRPVLHYLGGTMDPHQAWLVLRGIKTLAMRVRRAQENAIPIADLLAEHPAVEWVRYPGREKDPAKQALIARQMDGPGSLISFELKGGLEAGKRLLDGLKVMTLAVSLGGVETLIQHPASMTHAGMSRDSRVAAGISDGLVRLSVGCEDLSDLVSDLKTGLDALR